MTTLFLKVAYTFFKSGLFFLCGRRRGPVPFKVVVVVVAGHVAHEVLADAVVVDFLFEFHLVDVVEDAGKAGGHGGVFKVLVGALVKFRLDERNGLEAFFLVRIVDALPRQRAKVEEKEHVDEAVHVVAPGRFDALVAIDAHVADGPDVGFVLDKFNVVSLRVAVFLGQAEIDNVNGIFLAAHAN